MFVVEQNRDAQLKMLLVNECGIDPAKLTSVLHYDGTPITERFITREIGEKARLYNVTPLQDQISDQDRKAAAAADAWTCPLRAILSPDLNLT